MARPSTAPAADLCQPSTTYLVSRRAMPSRRLATRRSNTWLTSRRKPPRPFIKKALELCRGRDHDGALRALHAALKRGKATGIDDELSVVHEAIDAEVKNVPELMQI